MSLSTSQISELDYLFKNDVANKVKTDTTATPILVGNEAIYTAKIVTGDNVWLASSKLKQGATAAIAASIVVKQDYIKMYSVHISDIPQLVGIAWNSGIKNWVDPFIHPDFSPKFYVALSTDSAPYTNIISSSAQCPFVFDYKTGILTFLDAPYNANGYNITQLNGSTNTKYNVYVSGYTYSGASLDKLKGGSAGEALIKNSDADYDVSWTAVSTGGGGSGGGVPSGGVQGQVLTKNSTTPYDASWANPGLTWKDDFVPGTTSLGVTSEVYAYNNIAYTSVTDTILKIDSPPNKIVFEFPGSPNGYTVDPAYKSTYQSLKIYAPDFTNSRINSLTKAPLSTTATRNYTSSIFSTQSAGSYLNPTSICFDEFSNLYTYILDSGHKLIKRVVVNGPTTGDIQTVNLTGEILYNPNRIILNSTGTILYVSDVDGLDGFINKIVLSISSTGEPIGTVSTIATWLGSPVGLVLDNTEKYIYVTDRTKHTVSQILVESPHTVVNFAGSSGTSGNTQGYGTLAKFNGPTDIAIDYLGMLYVSDTNNNSIRTIDIASGGGIVSTFASNISSPAGISVDSFKNVYVASNGSTNQIIKISQSLSQTILVTGTTSLNGIYILQTSDIPFYYPLVGSTTGTYSGALTYPIFQQLSDQPMLFPYVSQYMMEIVPIYFAVRNYVTPTNDFAIKINITETPGAIDTSYKNRIQINQSGAYLIINNAIYSTFNYVDNPDFTKTSMTFGDSIRIYRVGSVLRVCVISGITQLTMAKIDLSAINEELTKNYTFDVNYDVIPILLSGTCQYSRFTIYKLPILERITERIPDTTVYTSWHQTYSPSQDSSYSAGSIIQSNNSLYIRSNIPNTAILDKTLNSPIYDSSFKGTAGYGIGTGTNDGSGLSATFVGPNQIIYDEPSGQLYLQDGGTIKTVDIVSSSSNPPVVSRVGFGTFTIYNNKFYRLTTGTAFAYLGLLRASHASMSDYIVSPNGTDFLCYSNTKSLVPDGQGNLFVSGQYQIPGGGDPYGERPAAFIAKYSIANDTLTAIIASHCGYSDGPLPQTNSSTPAFASSNLLLAYDAQTNRLFISDSAANSIRVLNSSGPSTSFTELVTIAGYSAGYRDDVGRQALFNNPQEIALDGSGNLYICDSGNKLIRKLNIASGLVTTVAGIYGKSGFIDGMLGTSTLSAPQSITFVPSSNLMYFTELQSNLVRSLNILTNEVRTVAGNMDVLKDLYTLDKKTLKITSSSFAVYAGGSGGINIQTYGAGQYMGYVSYLTSSGGSILEYSVFAGSPTFLQIGASQGGYTYVRIGYAGANYFDGSNTTGFPYDDGYTWQSGDTLRVIKQLYYIYVQYIRNNVVKNILGFNTPIYSPAGFQNDCTFSMAQVPSGQVHTATTHLVEYPLPVWDLLLTDSSANVTDNFSIALGTGTNTILYSANGLAWFPVSGAQFTISGSRVAWDGSLWFAVGSGTYRILWSSNGTSWSTDGLVVQATFTAGNDVASNGYSWIAVGTGTTPVVRSTNSLDWTDVTVTGLTTGKAVAWNGSSWVLGGVGTSSLYSSSDGVNWIAAASGAFSIECNGLATNGRIWVAVGDDANTSTVAYSSNGSSWTKSALFTTRGNGIAWNGKMWIAIGEGTYQIYFSTNGSSWSRNGVTIFGSSSIGKSIAWNSNLWIATGTWYSSDNSSILSSIITSPDGLLWTPVYGLPFTDNIASGCASRQPLPNKSNSVVSSKGMFVYDGSGTTQSILNSTVTSTSNIMITLATANPSVPSSLVFVSGITAGIGFSVKGNSGDLSTYNYIIL